MVLRQLVGLLLFLLAVPARAEEPVVNDPVDITGKATNPANRNELVFEKAIEAHLQEKFVKSLGLLKKMDAQGRAQLKTLELLVRNHEALKEYAKALQATNVIIKTHFKVEHSEVQAYLANPQSKSFPQVSEKLLAQYAKKADLYSRLLEAEFGRLSEETKRFYRTEAIIYGKLADKGGHSGGEVETSVARIKTLDQVTQDAMFKNRWFFSLGFISWQEKLKLENKVTNERIPMFATTQGLCVGGGYQYVNNDWEYNVQGCYASALATVGEQVSSVDYLQKGVGIYGLLGGPGIMYKPETKDVAFGFNIPMFFRKGDFQDPSAEFEFKDKARMSIGFLAEGRWMLGRVGMDLKVGQMAQLQGYLWLISGNYQF